MKILVTGGAGYIGSFMAKALLDNGYDVIVFDSLERGHRDVVDKRAKFVQGDLKSPEMLDALFSGKNIDSVMHFAAYTSVEESTKYPEKYYENNTKGSENLVKAMIRVGKVDKFIFSSTSAIYGNPIKIPIPEDHPKNPINPYGKSKLKVEEMLVDFQQKERLNFVSLRYFNAAGAALDASMGENHSPELHIIPLAIKSALSNKDVLSMVKKQSGIDFKVKIAKRRSGDPEVLVSDPSKIMKELGFKPKYSDLETIVGTALKWHRKNSK